MKILVISNLMLFLSFCVMTTLSGWKMERGAKSLHCTVLPSHSVEGADQFLADLRIAVETLKVS